MFFSYFTVLPTNLTASLTLKNIFCVQCLYWEAQITSRLWVSLWRGIWASHTVHRTLSTVLFYKSDVDCTNLDLKLYCIIPTFQLGYLFLNSKLLSTYNIFASLSVQTSASPAWAPDTHPSMPRRWQSVIYSPPDSCPTAQVVYTPR